MVDACRELSRPPAKRHADRKRGCGEVAQDCTLGDGMDIIMLEEKGLGSLLRPKTTLIML